MKSIAIITARGGSKRIPRKNIKPFLGKPIIEYSIEAAIQSGIFDEVMVSTDDKEIAEVAKKAGAKVPFLRSAETSNDYAKTADVIEEVIMQYRKLGQEFDEICCIYPTAPFITPKTLRQAMETLETTGADSVLPVVRFSFPPQRCVVMDGEFLTPKWPECMPMRSQDLEPMYHDCGQFYCMNTKRFLEERNVIMQKTAPFIQAEERVQDIDTEEDWKIAEMKYRMLNEADR